MRLATRTTAASLANSLGVIDTPPTMIQRRAPLAALPIPGTRTASNRTTTTMANGSAARRHQP